MERGSLLTATETKRLSIFPSFKKSSRILLAPAASNQQSIFAVGPFKE